MSKSNCRLCKSSNENLFNIFEHEFVVENMKSVKIFEALNYLLEKDKISNSDKSSHWICISCSENLYQCYEFCSKVRLNEKLLSETIESDIYFDIVDVNESTEESQNEDTAMEADDENATIETIDIVELNEDDFDTKTDNDPDCNKEIEIIDRKRPKICTKTKLPDHSIDFFVVPKFIFVENTSEDAERMSAIHILNIESQEIKFSQDSDYSFLDQASKEESDVIYMCKYCPKAFSSEFHLLSHVRNTHLCTLCLACFTKYTDVNKHVKTVHVNINCPYCQKCSPNPSVFRMHLKKNHHLNLPPNISTIPSSAKEHLIE